MTVYNRIRLIALPFTLNIEPQSTQRKKQKNLPQRTQRKRCCFKISHHPKLFSHKAHKGTENKLGKLKSGKIGKREL